jgi:autotransporter-associated beta strand protein
LSVPLALGGTQTFNAVSNSIVLSNSVADDSADSLIGGVVASGTNALMLTGINTYSGPTTVNTNSTLTIGGSGQLGSGTYAAVITNNGVLNYNSSAAQTLSGAISGSGLMQNGAGILTLPNANTYTGGTLINGGVVSIANAASLGTGTVTNNGGTILMPTAAALTVANNLWFTGTSIVDQDNYVGNNNFSGTFSGNGTLIITNLSYVSSTTYSTFTIQGSMSGFAGAITVAPDSANGPTEGFIRFNSGTTVNNTGSALATFNLGGGDSEVILTERDPSINYLGALTGGPNTALEGSRNTGTATWIIGGLNTSTTFAGTIEDADATEATPAGLIAAITKVGTGTLTLGGANVYSGGTMISNGVLNITGSLSTGVGGGTLNSVSIYGGTLAGSGIINVAVTNYSGGTLAPGAGVSTAGTVLTVNSNLTLLAGSTNIFQVSHINATNDSVVSGGTITYGGVLTVVTNAGDSAFTKGDKFTLFVTNGVSGGYAGSFIASNLPPLGAGLAWSNSLAIDGSIEVISNGIVTPPAPVAGFSGTPTNIFVTQTVTFTDASSGSITNWIWNFGDGHSVTNSSNTSVNHAYAVVGTNTVSLTVNGAGGSSTNTRVNYIAVKSKPAFGKPVLSGNSLILSGVNGPAGQQYRILSSTNVALPLANWTPVYTNTFDADGSYGYTNSTLVNKADFLLLVSP